MDTDSLTLWHGHRRLGRLHLREARSTTWITGVLLPDSEGVRLWGLRQYRTDIFPGRPAIQRRLAAERLWDGGEEELNENEGPRSTIIPRRVFMVPTFGVPADEQLSICNASGQMVQLDTMSLREVKVGHVLAPQFGWPLPPEALHRGSGWKVSGSAVRVV